MLSPELERLIDLAVADGEITDQERRVLYKKVQETGADVDEFEMTLEAKLYMVKEKQNAQAQAAQRPVQAPPAYTAPAPQTNKMGDVRKCPSCGAHYQAGSIYCVECGHEFTGVQASTAVARFSEMLRDIEMRNASQGSLLKDTLAMMGFGGDGRQREIATAIQTFPIPNSKEDLLEFILFLKPKAEMKSKRGAFDRIASMSHSSLDESRIYEAYKEKYEECLNKAAFYIAEDTVLVEKLRMHGIIIGGEKKKKRFGLF